MIYKVKLQTRPILFSYQGRLCDLSDLDGIILSFEIESGTSTQSIGSTSDMMNNLNVD